MKIEREVTCLELSKQLKAAGYPQDDNVWYWTEQDTIGLQLIQYAVRETRIAAAPTVAELGEKLKSASGGLTSNLPYWSETNKMWRYGLSISDTEADARAKMWLYLKEKGLLVFPTHDEK